MRTIICYCLYHRILIPESEYGILSCLLRTLGYESFDLSKTHSLSTQDLIKFFIHSFISMTAGKLSKYRNMLFSHIINRPRTMYNTSEDSETLVESKYINILKKE